ncbi:MAG: phosphoribosylaminoimidazolesuccinocarboxamide synthase [Wenyingzhuangia sp.]|jgi:phosphoribosylaminoimidazole-succinocarboxamide synthase|uniref:phosphoribosylaminoimidazolesuccinocarboxamide synthase n=1 Tax=Wenyingzhuangia sp. TaxID=1964193 RepID=UPI003219B282
MSHTINDTNFSFPGQTAIYKGKVREVYTVDQKLVMVASDRLSAFDVIMPKQIPYKGQILNQIAAKMLDATKHICPNWVLGVPDPNVTVGYACEPFKVEMVVRGYCTGHAWRTYKNGERVLCGVKMPDGMKENDKFPTPIITPTTKADLGDHDEDISREAIIANGVVSEEDYKQLESYTLALFREGTALAAERGLILVDTKYEFGKTAEGKIVVIDEIHTPDSSRYFYKEGYQERQDKGISQKQLSKEFVRQWLIENGFQGKDGQQIPDLTTEKIEEISNRYIELYEQITGEVFVKADISDVLVRIENNVSSFLAK